MIDPADFHRMRISVPAGMQEQLTDGEALICSDEQVQFVLVHIENVPAWRAALEQIKDDPRPAYLVLINHYERTLLDEGDPAEVDVKGPRLVKVGTIQLTPENPPLRSEHGEFDIISTTAEDLAKGDFFAVSERTEPWRDWVVYQASADFNSALGEIEARRTTEMEAERTGGRPAPTVTFRGANQVVFLVINTEDMLDTLGWDREAASA